MLLAAYNGAPWIADQIRSILAQDGIELRLHIRDDGSTDATRDQVVPFLDTTSVQLTSGAMSTGSAALNFFTLIRETPAGPCDYIALADQDDVWHRNKLGRAHRRLVDSRAAGYSSATQAVWASGKSTVLTQAMRASPSDFLFGGIGQGCTFVLTRGFYERVRAFLAANSALTGRIHYHDWALYALARTWGLDWTFDPVPSVWYRQHERNDTGARRSIGGLLKRLELIRRGWYGEQLRAIASMCAAADPSNDIISGWHALLSKPDTWSRRMAITRFCLAGGRRNSTDNAILVLAGLSGWV